MENASKALIIVGAVLIAILLIGFGVMIMNNSTSQVNPDALNSQAAQAHNVNFTNYTGSAVKAAQVKALLNNITTNNVTGATADEPQKVYVFYTVAGASSGSFLDPNAISAQIRNGYTYNVAVTNQNAMEVNPDEITNLAGAEPSDSAQGANARSYYTNGYIRCIVITENARVNS